VYKELRNTLAAAAILYSALARTFYSRVPFKVPQIGHYSIVCPRHQLASTVRRPPIGLANLYVLACQVWHFEIVWPAKVCCWELLAQAKLWNYRECHEGDCLDGLYGSAKISRDWITAWDVIFCCVVLESQGGLLLIPPKNPWRL
jgi:hypothetical protein